MYMDARVQAEDKSSVPAIKYEEATGEQYFARCRHCTFCCAHVGFK